MWTVGSETINGITNYFVFDRVTGERKKGSFDSPVIAQELADFLNGGNDGEGKSKGRYRFIRL